MTAGFLSVQAANLMLDALNAAGLFVGTASAEPGSTGANPNAGITRQALTFAASASGSITQTNTPSVPGLADGDTVAFLTLWKHVSSTSVAHYMGKQAVTPQTVTGSTWSYDVAAGTIDLLAAAFA